MISRIDAYTKHIKDALHGIKNAEDMNDWNKVVSLTDEIQKYAHALGHDADVIEHELVRSR